MITISIRETARVINHELRIQLPKTFDYDEVDVIIVPKIQKEPWEGWQNGELDRTGTIGYSSKSFVEDPEDFSQW